MFVVRKELLNTASEEARHLKLPASGEAGKR
jgi:hypothetical protein